MGRPKKETKEAEEPTVTCQPVKSVPVDRSSREICEDCNNEAYRDSRCHHHYKLHMGFVFDEDKKLYVKKTKEKK